MGPQLCDPHAKYSFDHPAVEYAHDHSFRHGFHGGAQPIDVASVLGIGR